MYNIYYQFGSTIIKLFRVLIFSCTLFYTLLCPDTVNDEYTKVRQYVYKKCKRSRLSSKIASRYYYCIVKYSAKYNVEPLLIARQIERESCFIYWAVNKKTKATGCAQLIDKWCRRFLLKCDNGKLAKEIKRKSIKNIQQFYKRIGYSCECICMIMRHLTDTYKSYEVGLLKYAYKPEFFRKYRDNPYQAEYVRKIMGAE